MDIQKKKIVSDYLDCKSYSKVAKKHDLTAYKVKKIVESAEESEDVVCYMQSKKDAACNLIEVYLDELTNREKLESTPLPQLATIMGMVIDKFTKNEPAKGSARIEKLIEGLKDE